MTDRKSKVEGQFDARRRTDDVRCTQDGLAECGPGQPIDQLMIDEKLIEPPFYTLIGIGESPGCKALLGDGLHLQHDGSNDRLRFAPYPCVGVACFGPELD